MSVIAVGLITLSGCCKTAPETEWHTQGLAWKTFEKGLAQAAETKRPICLIFFTTGCPHCKAYSQVFNAPRVVERSKNFVMVRLDRDKNAEVSQRYSPAGHYIPRTSFLTPTGVLRPEIATRRVQFRCFYDKDDASDILHRPPPIYGSGFRCGTPRGRQK